MQSFQEKVDVSGSGTLECRILWGEEMTNRQM